VVELLVLDFAGVCTLGPNELEATVSLAESVRPQCVEVVDAAKAAGITVAILSNEVSYEWAETVPLLRQVDHVIACTDNGILKPDRRAFERALYVAGTAAEATLVVDDDEDNVRVAASLGTHAIHFNVSDPDRSWKQIAELLEFEP